jgi:hypothetical protein
VNRSQLAGTVRATVGAGDTVMPNSNTPRLLLAAAACAAADPSLAITLRPARRATRPAQLATADIADWAAAYVRAQQAPDLLAGDGHPLWWAVEQFLRFSAAGRFEDCWSLVLEVLRLTSDPDVLGVLAAGPLEDIIEHAGAAFIDRIERQAGADPAFRRLLEGTWPCGSPAIWARIESARRPGACRPAKDLPRQVH